MVSSRVIYFAQSTIGRAIYITITSGEICSRLQQKSCRLFWAELLARKVSPDR